MTALSTLLADCKARGVDLALSGDDGLVIDGPELELTPSLLARLKANKRELRAALLGNTHELGNICELGNTLKAGNIRTQICRCGSTTWRDVTIHGGRSVRRDCAKCGRFLVFVIWYEGIGINA